MSEKHNEDEENVYIPSTREVARQAAADIEQQITTLTELLVSQLAEIRAQGVTQAFMLMTFLEHNGCDGETLLTAVEKMTNASADHFEAAMRKACDLPPLQNPRESILEKMRQKEAFKNVDWSKMREN